MTRFKNWTLEKYVAVRHGGIVDAVTRNEEGQGLAEYGLILALIAIACVVALTALGGGIAAKLNSVKASL